MEIILITHDLGVVAGIADQIQVMHAGRIAESAHVHLLFSDPRMPYTVGLLASIPRIEGPHHDRPSTIPELFTIEVGHLSRCYLALSDRGGT